MSKVDERKNKNVLRMIEVKYVPSLTSEKSKSGIGVLSLKFLLIVFLWSSNPPWHWIL